MSSESNPWIGWALERCGLVRSRGRRRTGRPPPLAGWWVWKKTRWTGCRQWAESFRSGASRRGEVRWGWGAADTLGWWCVEWSFAGRSGDGKRWWATERSTLRRRLQLYAPASTSSPSCRILQRQRQQIAISIFSDENNKLNCYVCTNSLKFATD